MRRADGKSFRDVLRDARGGRNAMLEDHPVGGETGKGHSGPWWGVRTRDWHLVEWNGTHLYDLGSDPWQMRDVINDHLDVAARLADRWNRPLSILQPSPPPPTSGPSLSPTPTAGPTNPPPKSPAPLVSPSNSPQLSWEPSSQATPRTSDAPIKTAPPSQVAAQASPRPTATDFSDEAVAPVEGSGPRDVGPGAVVAFSAIAVLGVVMLLARPRFRAGTRK